MPYMLIGWWSKIKFTLNEVYTTYLLAFNKISLYFGTKLSLVQGVLYKNMYYACRYDMCSKMHRPLYNSVLSEKSHWAWTS